MPRICWPCKFFGYVSLVIYSLEYLQSSRPTLKRERASPVRKASARSLFVSARCSSTSHPSPSPISPLTAYMPVPPSRPRHLQLGFNGSAGRGARGPGRRPGPQARAADAGRDGAASRSSQSPQPKIRPGPIPADPGPPSRGWLWCKPDGLPSPGPPPGPAARAAVSCRAADSDRSAAPGLEALSHRPGARRRLQPARRIGAGAARPEGGASSLGMSDPDLSALSRARAAMGIRGHRETPRLGH